MFKEKIKAYRAKSAANRKIPIYRSSVPRFNGHQNTILALTVAVVLLGILNISAVRAENIAATSGQSISIAQSAPAAKGEGARRPPREALDACANVKPQAACSFAGRDGKEIKGKCSSPQADAPLACAPAHPPKKG